MRDEEERMREFSHHNATLKHHAPTPSVGSTATGHLTVTQTGVWRGSRMRRGCVRWSRRRQRSRCQWQCLRRWRFDARMQLR